MRRSARCLQKRCSHETRPPGEEEVKSAIQELEERLIEHRQRELRGRIGEAERRGDYAEVAVLTQQKLVLDRALRELHRNYTKTE